MRVSLIGVGCWGKHLARNFFQMGALHSLCDLEKKDLFPGISWSRDVADLLKNPSIKQIAIATPPKTHYLLAEAALLEDKDVFVEKPLCFSTDEAKKLTALAHQRRKILMVGHILHYHSSISLLKKIVRSGQLGEIRSVEAIRSSPTRKDVSALWDLGPHDISLLYSLFGSSPTDLVCEGTEDDCRLTLTFLDSLQATVSLCIGKKRKEQKLLIVGSRATAIFQSNETLTLIPGSSFRVKKEPLREECEHFLTCCQTRRSPLTDGNEAFFVIQTLQKAEEKMRLPCK